MKSFEPFRQIEGELCPLEKGPNGYLCSEGELIVFQTVTADLPELLLCGEALLPKRLRRQGQDIIGIFERLIDTWAGRTVLVLRGGHKPEQIQLDIGPHEKKLSVSAWEELIQELSQISNTLPWGMSPGAAAGRTTPDALASVHPAIIEQRLPTFCRLLRQLLSDPPTQLFDLVSLVIVAGVRVTSGGGGVTTLGELMRKVWELKPAHRYERDLQPANAAANEFSTAFNAALPDLQSRLSEFLEYFENHQVSVTFQPISLAWDKRTLQLAGAELVPQISFRGKTIIDYHHILNEARLSAIAICLFLAGVVLSDNDYSNPHYPRFLVLDDALIGLDLENRLPVLRILTTEHFKRYQIFLFTHDRVWFDLARGHLPEKQGWIHLELIADEDTGRLVPRLKSSESDVARAKQHLKNGDLKAAAVYARSAFEWRVRAVCQRSGIKISYKPDADKVGVGELWDGLVQRQKERAEQIAKGAPIVDFVPDDLMSEVETMRSTVLNKLSHTGTSGLVQAEVAAAIATVERVFAHPFPKS